MVKGKRPYRRSRRSWIRRHRPKTIPIAPIAGFIGGTLFGVPYSYGASPVALFQQGDIEGAVRVAVGNMTGLHLLTNGVEFNAAKALNPFDFSTGAGWKAGFWGYVIHRIAGVSGVNKSFMNLPSPLNKLRV